RYAMDAIQVHPKGWESHMQLGSLLVSSQHFDTAEQVLRQASELQPDNAYIMQLLVMTLYQQKKTGEALALLQSMLASAPDNDVLRYFHGMLSGERIPSAPRGYIVNLFNHYA